jgi:hypothetical protein
MYSISACTVPGFTTLLSNPPPDNQKCGPLEIPASFAQKATGLLMPARMEEMLY